MATIQICDKCGRKSKLKIDTTTEDHVVLCRNEAGFSFGITMFKGDSQGYAVAADLCRKCLIEEVSFALLNL